MSVSETLYCSSYISSLVRMPHSVFVTVPVPLYIATSWKFLVSTLAVSFGLGTMVG